MARLFTAGNELADPEREGWYWNENITYSSVTQRGGFRSTELNGGNWYYYVPQNWDLVHHLGIFGRPTFPTANAFGELYVRFHFNMSSGGVSGERSVMAFWGPNHTRYFTFHIYDQGGSTTDGNFAGIRIREDFSGTIWAQATNAFINNVWNLFEVRLKLGAAGTGEVAVRINEVVVASASGTLVGPSGETTMSGVSMENIQLSGSTRVNFFDNWAINDTSGTVQNSWPGQGYTILRVPQRAGATTQLTNDLGTSGADNANRLGVDDHRAAGENDFTNRFRTTTRGGSGGPSQYNLPTINPGFVRPTAVPQKDTYKINELPFDAGAIRGISVFSMARSKASLSSNMRHLLQPPAQAEVQGAQLALPTAAPEHQATHFSENPNTGNEFTVSEVNDLELGLQFEA